ncbi:MAG: hypothetical protein EOM64_08140, partial [Erysipelotrichia bacterium]|nr:hypothetical protein [Erysipelotrichia bacterium]
MNTAVIFAVLVLILCEGIGAGTKKLMKEHGYGFSAPIGFAVLLTVLELCYFPSQLAGLPFMWNAVVTGLVLLFALGFTIWQYKEVFRKLFRWRTLIVIAYAAFFVISMTKRIGSPETFAAVVNTEAVRFQGYYSFTSVFSYFINAVNPTINITATILMYFEETLYYALTAMLVVNIVWGFHLRNQWLGICISIFLLFSGNFTTALSSSGELFRLFFVTLSVYVMYTYVKEGDEQIKYLLLFTLTAGMAASQSFLFLASEMVLCFTVYLFSIRKIRSLFDAFTFAIPLVFYVFLNLCSRYPLLAWTIQIIYAWFLVFRYRKKPRRIISRSEEYFFDHAVIIFYFVLPAVLAVCSLILRLVLPAGTVSYLDYFKAYPVTDTVADQLFVHSDLLGIMVTALRWAGVAAVIALAKSKEDQMIRTLMILMLIVFLNPLTVIALSQSMTGSLYYRGFEILFNPVTLMVILAYIYKFLEWQVFWQ